MFGGNGSVLPGSQTAAGKVLLDDRSLGGSKAERSSSRELALERASRLHVDGTTVSMPDTPKNQAAYPQVYNQKPGLGFPLARVCSLMSLSCGAVLDLGFARYAGKGQGELSLLRKLWETLSPGDILLTDALMSTWYEMLTLKQGGVDSVSRLNKATRSADFRRGKRLGKGDHIVRWPKPSVVRAVDWKTYKTLPKYVEVRETHVRVEQPAFAQKNLSLSQLCSIRKSRPRKISRVFIAADGVKN